MNDTATVAREVARPLQMTLALHKVLDGIDDKINVIVLSELTVGQVLDIDSTYAGADLEIMKDLAPVAIACGQPQTIIGRMSARDFRAAQRFVDEAVQDFTYDGDLPEELTIRLREPLEAGDKTHDTILLREPTAREMTAMQKRTGITGGVSAICQATGLKEADIRRMRWGEFTLAMSFINAFFV